MPLKPLFLLIFLIIAELCVAQESQTISFNPIAPKTMLDVPFSIIATASSGLPVTVSVSDPAILSISNSIATIKKPGTVTITVTQTGNDTYLPTTATQDVVITKVAQAITFDPIESRTADDSVFYVPARASSNLAVTFISSDPTVATIDQSGRVRIKKAGTVSITASQAGNDIYDPATPVTHDLVASKAEQVITLIDDGITRYVFDVPFTVRYTNTSGLTPNFSSSDVAVATISSTAVVSILKPGNFTITATQPGNDKYNAATPAKLDLTINKKSQTITFPPIATAGFLSKDVHSSATTTSGLPLTYTSSDQSVAIMHNDGKVEIFSIGSVTFTASQAGNDFYEPATPVSQTFEATREKQTISFTQVLDKRADAAAFQFIASASSGLAITFVSVDPSIASITSDGTITVHKAGPAQINLSQDGNAQFFPADPIKMKFNVVKQTQQINGFFFITDHLLSDDHFDLTTLTSSSGLPVTFRIVQGTVGQIRLNGNTVTMINAGKATIVAEQAGDGIYAEANPVSATFCVLPGSPILRQAIVSGETILTSSVAANVWIRDSKVIGFTGQQYKVDLPGTYQVIANVDGCVNGYSNSIKVGEITGLEDETGTGIELYPNPTKREITLRNLAQSQVSIFDMAGREQINQITGEGQAVIDVSSFAAGLYIVIIKNDRSTHRLKFIKQ
ncbi:MAG: T9SS type A sorting domain-containing protein [Bacteroidota bacterium]